MYTLAGELPEKIHYSEQELLCQVRVSGLVGERARSTLLLQHYPWIQARCSQILRNEADGQDAAQEVALQVYHNVARFEGRSALRTWIGAIATRQCLSLVRRNQRHTVRSHIEDLITLHEDVLRTDKNTDEQAEQRVNHTLHSLLPQSRDVLRLRFHGDKSLEDISRVLGISLSAAKMRLYRALDQFATAYAAVD